MKHRKAIRDIGFGALGLSVTSSVLGGFNDSVSAKGQQGLANVANYLPAMGTIAGGGMALSAVGELSRATKRRRRK